LVAVLCLLAQVLGLVHLALVQHATCLEHDALVHAPPGQAASDRGQGTPPAHPRAAVEQRMPDSAGHAEDHCLAVGFRRLDLAHLGSERALAAAPPPTQSGQPARDRIEPPPPVALLRLAPKSSPPSPPAV
jgi:hypothetical protein